ncbi:MAG: 2-dehydropantoate 2-reductase N-terminal domain-containing protein, partial [Pseudomonadota bacterium]
MRISVIGAGYVGLVSGACLADAGNHVTCIDVDEKKITDLSEGKVHIHETGLEEIVTTNLLAKRLLFTSSVEHGISGAEVIVIAVGTPQKEDGSAELTHVLAAARSIAQWIEDYVVVVTKSTVPVGSGDAVRKEIDAVLAQRD